MLMNLIWHCLCLRKSFDLLCHFCKLIYNFYNNFSRILMVLVTKSKTNFIPWHGCILHRLLVMTIANSLIDRDIISWLWSSYYSLLPYCYAKWWLRIQHHISYLRLYNLQSTWLSVWLLVLQRYMHGEASNDLFSNNAIASNLHTKMSTFLLLNKKEDFNYSLTLLLRTEAWHCMKWHHRSKPSW